MTLKQYLALMLFATTLCWVSWVFVLLNVDPFTDGGIGLVFFYITLLFSLVGTISICSFLVVQLFLRQRYPLYRWVKKTFTFGCISAAVLISILFLQGKGVLEMWNIVLLLIIAFGVLIFQATLRPSPRS